jgi:dihydrofolate reductase
MEKMLMSVNAILAVDDNNGIGWNNELPWPHNKRDMQWFRECTSGHVVVMGRNTWESFGNKPLPKRVNVVVTNRTDLEGAPDRVTLGDMKDVIDELKKSYPGLKIFIIGGANLYRQALPYCDKLYISKIKGSYKCDTYMNESDFAPFDLMEYIEADIDLSIQIRGRSK